MAYTGTLDVRQDDETAVPVLLAQDSTLVLLRFPAAADGSPDGRLSDLLARRGQLAWVTGRQRGRRPRLRRVTVEVTEVDVPLRDLEGKLGFVPDDDPDFILERADGEVVFLVLADGPKREQTRERLRESRLAHVVLRGRELAETVDYCGEHRRFLVHELVSTAD